jgi:hypothetical protein
MILFSNIHLFSFGFLDRLIPVSLKSLFVFFQILLTEFLKITFFGVEYLDLVTVFEGLFVVALASF